MITFDDFKKIEMKIGLIKDVEVVEDADKLLKLTVDFDEGDIRTIVSGIREHYEDPNILVGKRVPFVTNLEPRIIRGVESNGMILAVNDKEGAGFSILETQDYISEGSRLS